MAVRVRHHHVVCVTAFVPDGDGRVLLVRPNRRGWEMPGGRVDPGEDVAEAAVREVEEETGCDVAVEALLGIDCRISDPEVLFVRFRCRYLGGSTRPSAETPEVGWFTYDDARAMVTDDAPASRLADVLADSDRVLVRRFTTRPYKVHHAVELGPR
jgi:8-oxo-dGTP pyrophosphatase MutT (NUDIX family)